MSVPKKELFEQELPHTVKWVRIVAYALNTSIETIYDAYKEDRTFRIEMNKAALGEKNDFNGAFEKWKTKKK